MRVVMLAPPRVQSLDIVGPAEIFWEAARRLDDPTAYEVQIMGTCNEPVCGTGALRFLCERTAAAVTAGMDLALTLVEEDFGRDLALIVARYMVMFLKRPGGQSQFSAHLVGQMSERSPMQTVVEHILANLRVDHSVEVLAKRARMSTRNFARVFWRELDMTPTEFVESARSDAARRMLQDTGYPLQHIATVCGFGTVGSMRRVFVRNLGLRPLDYRQAFRSALRPEPPKPPGRAKGQASSTAVLM